MTTRDQQGAAPQRLAVAADAPQLGELMRASVRSLFPAFYTAAETASAAEHITHPDLVVIGDGTYFVHEAGGQVVACGGWSRRGKLHGGSEAEDGDQRPLDPATEPARVRAMFVREDWTRRGLGRAILASSEEAARRAGFHAMTLMATLPGVPLYAAFGFTEVEREPIVMPDGSSIAGVVMERPIKARP